MIRTMLCACGILLFAPSAHAMTLSEAVDTALKNNPDLQAVRLEKDDAQGKLDQAGIWLRSNPVVEASRSRKDTVPGGGEKATNYGFSLSQEFEIAGQRGLRIDAAKSGMEKTAQDIRNAQRILVAEVKDSFAKALAAQLKVELANEVVRLQEQLVNSANVKVQAGEISQLEQNLADVELGKARREHLLAAKDRREALFDLQMLLGLTPKSEFSVEGDLPAEVPAIPGKEKLRSLTASQRPDVLSASAEVQQARSAMKLAGREAVPSFTVGAFYQQDDQLNETGVMLTVPLPLFDRKQAGRKEAAAKAGQAIIRQASLQRSIEREIEEAYANLVSASEELSLFKKDVLGKALENLELMNLAFQEGKFGFFEVRLAQKDTIDAQFAYLESQVRLQLALNALEKVSGGNVQ
jgi:cobalt-zinc-cadmium efflux system outer membrane protein